MSEPFIGEIKLVGCNFAPRGWANCDGQLMEVSQNTALFSLLGTTYGGDGRTTFALPDFRSRIPLHSGQGPGLSNRVVGQKGGSESVTLAQGQMPVHNHTLIAMPTGTGSNQTDNPLGAYVGNLFFKNTNVQQMQGLTAAGGSASHENRQPLLTLRYCIALQGIYPSRD